MVNNSNILRDGFWVLIRLDNCKFFKIMEKQRKLYIKLWVTSVMLDRNNMYPQVDETSPFTGVTEGMYNRKKVEVRKLV